MSHRLVDEISQFDFFVLSANYVTLCITVAVELTLPQSITEINAHNAKDHGNALRRFVASTAVIFPSFRARWTIQRLGTSQAVEYQLFMCLMIQARIKVVRK